MSNIKELQVTISQAQIDDLKTRLQLARFPEQEVVEDWSQGIPLNYVRDVTDYWLHQYDFQRLADRLNAHPNFTMELDGLPIHFLHLRSPESNAKPLIMTHGWPGSVVEFLKVIGPLTDPVAHGGDPADAFHLVCPSLPGFGFSGKPTTPGWGVEKIGAQWAQLMANLGYSSYFALGGDWGSIVSTNVALADPKHCVGLHVNMAVAAPDPATMDSLTPSEQSALEGLKYYQDWDSGYSKQQSTRPQTIGYSLVDSPVGQMAWILEKFYAWTDCDGHPENVLSRDEMLDNVMVYWLNAAGASSARLYWESFGGGGSNDPIAVPFGASIFPKEIFRSSKRWLENRYTDLRYFNELETGGHFAAFEQPETFVAELRSCFRTMR